MRYLPTAAARLVTTAFAAATIAACGDDKSSTLEPTLLPDDAPSAAVTGTGTGPISTQMNARKCLDVTGDRRIDGTPIILWDCNGGPNQQWTWTAAGELRIYGNTWCLAATGGNNGDKLVLGSCNGSSSQKWTPTAASELRGVNGKCVDLYYARLTNGTAVTMYACKGSSNQRWNYPSNSNVPTAPTPTPVPAPAPTPAPTPTTGAAKVLALVGTVPSVSAIEALGGAFAKYEQDFRSYGDQRWSADGTYYDPANYYDRAMIYYTWWARTGNQTYLDRANALALSYRKGYLEARNYPNDPWWLMLDGVALHHLVTGDAASLTALGKIADRIAASGYVNAIGDVNAIDNRDQAKVLLTFVLAAYVKAPSAAGNDWGARARAALTKILSTQSSDGAYRMRGGNQCGYNKPFMVGTLNDAMIRYYQLFERDSRILPSIKKAVDYMWANDWRSGGQGFVYLAGTCGGDTPFIAADLNNLIASGFGFVYQQTRDANYKTRGDAVFGGAVYKGWLGGAKQFNQEYTSSFRYLTLRQ